MVKVMSLKEALDKTERERARCDALNEEIFVRTRPDLERHEPIEGGYQTTSPRAIRDRENRPWEDHDEEDYPVKQMGTPDVAVKRMGYVPGPSDGRPGNECEVFVKMAADLVNSPSHYTQGPTESIDVIRQALGAAGFKGFCVGNAIKYVHRARFKGTEDTDLKKAVWYLRMAVGDDPRKA